MKGADRTFAASALAPPLSGLETVAVGAPGRLVAAGDTFRPNAAALYGVEDVRGYESIVLTRLADTFPLWSSLQAASFNHLDALSRPFLSPLNVRYALAPPEAPGPPEWRLARRGDSLAVWGNPHVPPRAFLPKTLPDSADAARTLSHMAASPNLSQTASAGDGPAPPPDNGTAPPQH